MKEYFHNHCFRGVGIFALRDIKNEEELFVDYFHSKQYDVDRFTPDWLKKPPPMAPYYTKHAYETQFSFIAKMLDYYLLSQDYYKYREFEKKTSHDPQDNII